VVAIVKPVCLVIGAGAGIGGTVGRQFAREGYHAALCRRSDAAGLTAMSRSFEDEGLAVSGHLINAAEPGSLEQLVSDVEQVGPIDTLVYNLGAQIGNRSLEKTSLKTFELGWQIACFGLFRLAKVLGAVNGSAWQGHLLGDLCDVSHAG
jgi:NAD(P)-dependent dehydrogenase (short-subunit alcohol dehydrogenase family)